VRVDREDAPGIILGPKQKFERNASAGHACTCGACARRRAGGQELVENNSNLVMHKLILTIKKEQYISKVYDLSRALRSAANSNSPVLVTVAT